MNTQDPQVSIDTKSLRIFLYLVEKNTAISLNAVDISVEVANMFLSEQTPKIEGDIKYHVFLETAKALSGGLLKDPLIEKIFHLDDEEFKKFYQETPVITVSFVH